MFTRNIDLVVGLTTFNNDMLRLSVPALSRLNGRFYLVVYNDNPTTTVSRRDIRRLGYRGRLRVINGTENIGVLRARMAIINAVDIYDIRAQYGQYENIIIGDTKVFDITDEMIFDLFEKIQVPIETEDIDINNFKNKIINAINKCI